MWTTGIDELTGSTHRYRPADQTARLSWRRVVQLWQHSTDFTDWFGETLAASPFAAFFWETPPVVASGWDEPFEFVLVDSPALAGVRTDAAAFADHIRGPEPVARFDNLGRDAHLIAPTLAAGAEAAHLAAFLRSAPSESSHALWSATGRALEERVGGRPIWCSTSGLGVYWLHIRLDTYPKYYTHAPYRNRP